MHHRKCENLISYFTQQIQSLNEELQNERKWRDTHLAKILKALLGFETKLKNDQKHIRSQLYEKDRELNRLAGEMNAFRSKYNIKDDEPIQIDAIAQYCPNCRKQYYHLDAKDVGVQVMKQELSCVNESGECVCVVTKRAFRAWRWRLQHFYIELTRFWRHRKWPTAQHIEWRWFGSRIFRGQTQQAVHE